jgi:hypothetical protein
MIQDGLEKAAAGMTSIEELTRVCGCGCHETRRPAADSPTLEEIVAN